ncbi:hypothetical protein DSECCO2_594680 [anaerobic digester metagenome]
MNKLNELKRIASLDENSQEFRFLADSSGMTPGQYKQIILLEIECEEEREDSAEEIEEKFSNTEQNNQKEVNQERFREIKALKIFSFVLIFVCLLLSVASYYNGKSEYKNGYESGYNIGYVAGQQDTKKTYSSPRHNSRATVYVTPSGTKYHEKGCQYLNEGGIPISLKEAKSGGYSPCSKCDPPS